MLRRISPGWWLAAALLYFLYFFGLTATGLLAPDEPRYASIGREMGRSGDWVTPRLWGEPWFEKPALLYWMSAAAFRLGLDENLAPRLPVAMASVAFLFFYWRTLSREFGSRAAWFATLILGTCAGWLSYSYIGVTDLPMSATFSAAMLLSLGWVENGERERLPLAAALLGAAVLAKGLVPLVLAAPLVWARRRRIGDVLRLPVIGAFLLVAAPWYLLCFLRNGTTFLQKLFWEQQVGRFVTETLAHQQPIWFYLPVLAGGLLPWTPLLLLLFRRALYSDRRRAFLLAWACFGLMFFSASTNKLPGYLLPLLPALAALMGVALAEIRDARWMLAGCSLCLVFVPVLVQVLPQALPGGVSRSPLPVFHWTWVVPVFIAAAVWRAEALNHREAGLGLLGAAITAGVMFLKLETLPAVDQAVSARPLWRQIASVKDQVCVAQMHRSWRYGLNYYSVTPLPDCEQSPRPISVTQEDGQPPAARASGGLTQPRSAR